MFHSLPDHAVLSSLWRMRPPTGKRMRNALAALMPADEVEARLAQACNRSVTYVGWHLRSDAVVPACLLAAAMRLGDAAEAQQEVPTATLSASSAAAIARPLKT